MNGAWLRYVAGLRVERRAWWGGSFLVATHCVSLSGACVLPEVVSQKTEADPVAEAPGSGGASSAFEPQQGDGGPVLAGESVVKPVDAGPSAPTMQPQRTPAADAAMVDAANPVMLSAEWMQEARAVVDGSGRILVAWIEASNGVQSNPQSGTLRLREASTPQGWQMPSQVDTSAAQVALSGNTRGDALLTWVKLHPNYGEVYIRQRTPDGVWNQMVGLGAAGGRKPRCAIGEQGESALFYQTRESVFTVPYGRTTGRGAIRQVAPIGGADPEILEESWHVANVGDHTFEFVWGQYAASGATTTILETRRTGQSEWSDPTQLVTFDRPGSPIRWSSDTRAGVLMGCQDGCARFVSGRWLPTSACVSAGESLAAVALAANGDAFAANFPAYHDATLMVRRSADGDDWTSPESAGIVLGSASGQVQLAADAQGNAVVAWEHVRGSVISVWMNRYTKDQGWAEPSQLSRPNEQARLGALAVNAAGRGVIVWAEDQTLLAHTFE
jgi:hypothetical protein